MPRHDIRLSFTLALVVLVLVVGCAGGESGAGSAAAVRSEPEPLVVTPEIEAALALADGVDGATDGVVSLCPSCALAMDGSAEHAVDVGDYELHFCSDGCKDRFDESAETTILTMVEANP